MFSGLAARNRQLFFGLRHLQKGVLKKVARNKQLFKKGVR
jgi:hypothetical protein